MKFQIKTSRTLERINLISVLTLTTILLLPNLVLACFNPTDSFAFEVLLNKPGITYSLNEIKQAENVTISDSSIIYRSHHNPEIAVILREVNGKYQKGLSVRLQVPTKFVKISYPQTRIEIETNKELTLDKDFLESLGYEIKGEFLEERLKAELIKNNINIAIWSMKTDDGLHSGIHIRLKNETLTPELEEEFKSIVISFGVSEEDWNNRETTTQTIESMDLVALHNYLESFDFKTGIKVELEWLINNKIIFGLSSFDIQQISELAKAGLAGHNSRIVWENGWKPYYETRNPMLIKALRCGGFSIESLPEGKLMYLATGEALHMDYRTMIVIVGVVMGLFLFAYMQKK
jgi:hypothetical protein